MSNVIKFVTLSTIFTHRQTTIKAAAVAVNLLLFSLSVVLFFTHFSRIKITFNGAFHCHVKIRIKCVTK